jgi:hypothetical protein
MRPSIHERFLWLGHKVFLVLGFVPVWMLSRAILGDLSTWVIVDQFLRYPIAGVSALVIGAGLFSAGLVCRTRLRYRRQRRLEQVAGQLVLALQDDSTAPIPDYFLYIRAFETTRQLTPPLFDLDIDVWRLRSNEMESFIATALKKHGLLVGLGYPGENLGGQPHSDRRKALEIDDQAVERSRERDTHNTVGSSRLAVGDQSVSEKTRISKLYFPDAAYGVPECA